MCVCVCVCVCACVCVCMYIHSIPSAVIEIITHAVLLKGNTVNTTMDLFPLNM